MNYPISQNQALNHATQAYQNFERRRIPFAAVKLKIAAQQQNKNAYDEIVEDNYRREKDVIYNKDGAYVILMQDTTLEIAESATQRLKTKLGHLRSDVQNAEKSRPIQASAYILGSSKGSRGLVMRYLDLSPDPHQKPKVDVSQPSFNEYFRWLNAPEEDSNRSRHRISIKI
jgi:hypothetical protein